MRRLRIISIGNFGLLNSGDDLLRTAIEYIFQEHRLMFTNWFPGVDVLNGADLVVVGGGSIWPDFAIFTHAEAVARQLRVPIMVLGISARRYDALALAGTKKLAKICEHFVVRDLSTAKMFDMPGVVRHEPDLFWWMPWGEVCEPASSCQDVALNLREIGEDVGNQKAIYDLLTCRGYNIAPFPLHFGSPSQDHTKRNDFQLLRDFGLENTPRSWTITPVRSSRFVVAMRFHAVMSSLRLGRPVISFDYHPKIRDFFADNDISEYCLRFGDTDQLAKLLDKLDTDIGESVHRFAIVSKKLEAEGAEALIKCRRTLDKLASMPKKTRPIYRVFKKILSYV